MSTLSAVLIVLAGILFFVSIGGVYVTNVTAKPGGIPRWVMVLWVATVVVAIAAVVTLI